MLTKGNCKTKLSKKRKKREGEEEEERKGEKKEKKREVVPGLEPGIREVIMIDIKIPLILH